MKPDQPPRPPSDETLRKLEETLEFRKMFLQDLCYTLAAKKFGEDIYGEFIERDIDHALETLSNEGIIPEIRSYEKKLSGLTTVEQLLEFAKNEGLEFTEEEIRDSRNRAWEDLGGK